MKRVFEPLIFGGLAVALHLGFLTKAPTDGAEAAGNEGASLMSLQAANAQIEQMVADWEKPVEVTQTVAPLSQIAPPQDAAPVVTPTAMPDLAPSQSAAVALPDMTTSTPQPPVVDAPAPQPVPKIAPKARPKPKPAVKPKPVVKSAPSAPDATQTGKASQGQNAQKASGSGGGQAAGTAGKSSAASLSKSQQASLMAQWGAQIRSRINRKKRAPHGASKTGRTTLRITVARSGTITAAQVSGSSGIAALDDAALQAVSRAGKMPSAPKGLTEASYTFNLPIAFQ
ncbi:outer membrane transport energization protein TonB [Pacificibacter maritimus]|uniref:Outer membrane transport energization protein TonB n=1 Tax=Pacificibacter maritimus TaxID=762213 RepID=A0A3N4UUT0_9RHOB|nr:TonB family protein [Pacificibacter maritimus]RPE71341.1 outer membrane transport energization protein TonB [Pacificibacter maritimus]